MIRMIRRFSRVRVRPRRKGRPIALESEGLPTVLTADQIALNAFLHEQAAQTVCATLARMHLREQDAARRTPDLEPYLTAYFDASRHSLLQHTVAILDDHLTAQPSRHAAPSGWWSWRPQMPRLLPLPRRKEMPDGAA